MQLTSAKKLSRKWAVEIFKLLRGGCVRRLPLAPLLLQGQLGQLGIAVSEAPAFIHGACVVLHAYVFAEHFCLGCSSRREMLEPDLSDAPRRPETAWGAAVTRFDQGV